eukprot:12886394-Alexandrium_andersonii.AAC.1
MYCRRQRDAQMLVGPPASRSGSRERRVVAWGVAWRVRDTLGSRALVGLLSPVAKGHRQRDDHACS